MKSPLFSLCSHATSTAGTDPNNSERRDNSGDIKSKTPMFCVAGKSVEFSMLTS